MMSRAFFAAVVVAALGALWVTERRVETQSKASQYRGSGELSGFSNGGYGVSGQSDNVAIYATNPMTKTTAYLASRCCAGDFYGTVYVHGTLKVEGGKNFVIDNPIDPGHTDLYHASVESSEMKNLYDGVVTLDARGTAIIRLPRWFGALNKDFRYQLTAIGTAAPGLHIAKEIADNQFAIAGGSAGMKVSWMVTGVRQDEWARTHPMQVEQPKGTLR